MDSDMLKDTKRILYAEANVKEEFNSAIDINNKGEMTMGDEDSESNCDVDEHSDMMHSDGDEQ